MNEKIIEKLNPYIRQALYHKTKTYVLNERVIFDYELLYLEKGQLQVSIEDNNYILIPGDILLLKPGKTHAFHSIDDTTETWMPHIHFDSMYYPDKENVFVNFKTIDKLTSEELKMIREDVLSKIEIPDIIRIPNHQFVLDNIKTIITIYNRKEPFYEILMKSHFLMILYSINKGLTDYSQKYYAKHDVHLENAANYIIENYDQKIKIETLAKKCFLSVYYFEKLFKSKYNVSPRKFQQMQKIEKAKELLLYTDMSICAISDKIGYKTIHTFSKTFKAITGMTPTAFRLNVSNRGQC